VLRFGRQAGSVDVDGGAPQEKRRYAPPQRAERVSAALAVGARRAAQSAGGGLCDDVAPKVGAVAEAARVDNGREGVELVEVVHARRAREQEALGGAAVLDRRDDDAGPRLEAVALVHDEQVELRVAGDGLGVPRKRLVGHGQHGARVAAVHGRPARDGVLERLALAGRLARRDEAKRAGL
jgi:hypothetical protein